jgi:hypothetical protein
MEVEEAAINGPVEPDDSDWYMNRWRDEVVKDRTEGKVVSDDTASGWSQFEGRAIAPLS